MTRQLPVGDRITLVDDDVYEWALAYTWRLQRRRDNSQYVQRTSQIGHGAKSRRVVHFYLHREVLGLTAGDGKLADHINGDTLDNRRANLRVTDATGNVRNRRGRRGVRFNARSGFYEAMVWIARKRIYVGYSRSLEEAHRMAEEGRRQHYG